MINLNKNLSAGFTLVELLTVVAIIGLLASMILANLAEARVKAANSKELQSAVQLQRAIELYKASTGSYPQIGTSNNYNGLISNLTMLVPNYISVLPTFQNAFYISPNSYLLLYEPYYSCGDGNKLPNDSYLFYFQAPNGLANQIPLPTLYQTNFGNSFNFNTWYCLSGK